MIAESSWNRLYTQAIHPPLRASDLLEQDYELPLLKKLHHFPHISHWSWTGRINKDIIQETAAKTKVPNEFRLRESAQTCIRSAGDPHCAISPTRLEFPHGGERAGGEKGILGVSLYLFCKIQFVYCCRLSHPWRKGRPSEMANGGHEAEWEKKEIAKKHRGILRINGWGILKTGRWVWVPLENHLRVSKSVNWMIGHPPPPGHWFSLHFLKKLFPLCLLFILIFEFSHLLETDRF